MQQVSVLWIRVSPLGRERRAERNQCGTLFEMHAWTRCICLQQYTEVLIVTWDKNLRCQFFHTRALTKICSHTEGRPRILKTISFGALLVLQKYITHQLSELSPVSTPVICNPRLACDFSGVPCGSFCKRRTVSAAPRGGHGKFRATSPQRNWKKT